MSLNIDPIIRVFPDRKIRTVIVGITAGTNTGSAVVPGFQAVTQIIGAYLMGAGTTVDVGFAMGSPTVGLGGNVNTVGVSLASIATVQGVSAVLTVQGY